MSFAPRFDRELTVERSPEATVREALRGGDASERRLTRRPEAPFGRDAIHLWYASPLHSLETARLVHRALNPLPVCRALQPRPLGATTALFISGASPSLERKMDSESLELSSSRATSAPEASLKLDAIAPSGNALSAAADGAVL